MDMYVCICVYGLRHVLPILVEEPRISISFKNGNNIRDGAKLHLTEGVLVSFLCSATGWPTPEVCVCVGGGGGSGVCIHTCSYIQFSYVHNYQDEHVQILVTDQLAVQ